MQFGNYAVRYAPSSEKSKWVVEIHKTARAAMTAAKRLAVPRGRRAEPTPVCIFDMSRWGKKPLCIVATGSVQKGHRKHSRISYQHAPSGLKAERPGGVMRRLAWDSPDKQHRNPIVKMDGYGRRRKSRRS
jgi:hypothetical protein